MNKSKVLTIWCMLTKAMCVLVKIFLLQALMWQLVRERTSRIKHVIQYAWEQLIVTIAILLQSLVLPQALQIAFAAGGNSGAAAAGGDSGAAAAGGDSGAAAVAASFGRMFLAIVLIVSMVHINCCFWYLELGYDLLVIIKHAYMVIFPVAERLKICPINENWPVIFITKLEGPVNVVNNRWMRIHTTWSYCHKM